MYDPLYEIVINCKALIAHGYGILELIENPSNFNISKVKWHFSMIEQLSQTIRLLCQQFNSLSVGMIEENFLGKARYIERRYKRELESGGASGKVVRPMVSDLQDTFDEFIDEISKRYKTSYMDDLLN